MAEAAGVMGVERLALAHHLLTERGGLPAIPAATAAMLQHCGLRYTQASVLLAAAELAARQARQFIPDRHALSRPAELARGAEAGSIRLSYLAIVSRCLSVCRHGAAEDLPAQLFDLGEEQVREAHRPAVRRGGDAGRVVQIFRLGHEISRLVAKDADPPRTRESDLIVAGHNVERWRPRGITVAGVEEQRLAQGRPRLKVSPQLASLAIEQQNLLALGGRQHGESLCGAGNLERW
jgi:hypothetical protein